MKPFEQLACSVAAAWVAAAGCGDTSTTTASQLNLDRPVDVAFACYGGMRITGADGAQASDPTVVSPMPRKACDIYSRPAVAGATDNVPPGQEDLRASGGAILGAVNWYGLILQSATGSIALASFDTKPTEEFQGGDTLVLDTDPLTPGKNGISVGIEPVALTVDDSGCFAITANAGSCDASVLDLTTALARGPKPTVTRNQIKNASGAPIVARAAAMVAATGDAVIGQACPAAPTGLVYIAYPNCHMVAAVDVATMQTVAAITFDSNGVPQVSDGNVSCPAECGAAGATTDGVRPVTIAIQQDARVGTRRMVIGADNSSSVTMVELDAALKPVSASRVAFEDPQNNLGISDVALSPQIGLGGAVGMLNDTVAPGGQAQFVYAVASDGTVRVAEVLNLNKECDTQVDPRLLGDVRDIARLSCLPVGDALTPKRRALARGPGIELTGDAVPTAVAFLAIDSAEAGELVGPRQLVGHFAAITATTGSTFIVSIDDDNYPDLPIRSRPLESPLPFVMAHQLRDALEDRAIIAETNDAEPKPICVTNGPDPADTAGNRGGPRLTAAPSLLVSTTTIAPEKVGILPSIQQLRCEGSDETRAVSQLSFAAPVETRAASYPDLRALRSDETWTLTYEGSLSLDRSDNAIDGPTIRTALMSVATGSLVAADPAKPYCATGVEPFDIAQMRGCDPTASNRQCAFGLECVVHPESAFNVGICLPSADKAALLTTCRDYMVSLRRFAVTKTTAGELTFAPRVRELRTTPLSGCTSAEQCTDLALMQTRLADASHPKDDTTAAPERTWACEVNPARANPAPACVMTCTEDKDCDSGTVCENNRCVESVIPPAACIAGPQKFELRAGAAFAVVGSRSGFIHNVIADSAGTCVQNPNGNELLRGRIPLQAPPCTGDPVSPNPCTMTVMQTEKQPQYVAGSCVAADPSTALVTREAAAIHFSNPGMTFNLVDPTYPGDKLCRGDRAAGLVDVPTLYAGYTISFRQTAGFSPLVLGIQPAYPSKVIAGPTQSIWVIDQGDFLSESATLPSTRGKVFRIEGQELSTINIMQ
ncbi:MAG TPA: hypothetical protein PLF40_17745 [Kofleriaceae bacterium]|nr:hypothetical protein [Kofleriaceae bacterium]